MIEPIADYSDYGFSQYCIINESNENKYLYHFQGPGFSIYEIEGYGTDPEPEFPEQYFTIYPNPFSNTITFSFKNKNFCEFSKIRIYNVKGQLVRALRFDASSPLHSIKVSWDGKDEYGNDVKSGVYFYKIDNDDDHIGKVVKL